MSNLFNKFLAYNVLIVLYSFFYIYFLQNLKLRSFFKLCEFEGKKCLNSILERKNTESRHHLRLAVQLDILRI